MIECNVISFKCLRLKLNDSIEKNKSKSGFYRPKIPAKYEFIVIGKPRPSKIGAFDNLISFFLEAPSTTFKIGFISKQTLPHFLNNEMSWVMLRPFIIL